MRPRPGSLVWTFPGFGGSEPVDDGGPGELLAGRSAAESAGSTDGAAIQWPTKDNKNNLSPRGENNLNEPLLRDNSSSVGYPKQSGILKPTDRQLSDPK